MTTALIILAVLAAVFLVLLGAIAISASRQGTLAVRILGLVFGTRLGQKLAAKASGKLLAGEGSVSMEDLTELMSSHPEMIERMAAEQGLDPSTVQAAMAQFQNMPASQRKSILGKAQGAMDAGANTPEQVAAAVGNAARPRTADQARGAAKKKQAARARRKQAKRSRRS